MGEKKERIVLTGAVRTPMGSFGGGLKDVPAARLLAICFEETLNAQKELTKVLEGMGLLPAYPVDQTPFAKSKLQEDLQDEHEDDIEVEVDLEAFQSIFETASVDAVEEKDAKTFWEDLSNLDGDVEPDNPDVLTYEQARQLGLAPKDEADN